MKATFSPSTGFCIVDGNAGASARLMSVVDMATVDPSDVREHLSFARDWRVVEFGGEQAAFVEMKRLTMMARCVSLARLCVMVSDLRLARPLYSQIEELISAYASSEAILGEMLAAPYANPEALQHCAKDALSQGYGAAGHLFSRLFDLQPLLRRFADFWLQLPLDPFFNAEASKQEFWNRLRTNGHLLMLLEAPSREAVVQLFGTLAFEQSVPRNRSGIARLGNEIGNRLFGRGAIEFTKESEEEFEQEGVDHKIRGYRVGSWRSELRRTLREIDAIANAVAAGNDSLAEKFLKDLIDRQTAHTSQHAYAVKSLCNLAKQCADMLRADFERLCLVRAREIAPFDVWTMIQFGDHLKRTGQYQEAIRIVERALSYGAGEFAQSLRADIESQAGNYERAIAFYKSIPNWQRSPSNRTAIADNLRWLGRLEDAAREYDQIEADGLGSDRTMSGQAEIAKQDGDWERAKSLYRTLMESAPIEERSWWVYRTAYSGLLKQTGEYEEALGIIEDVVARVPFAMHARVMRASIWGLLGNADKALGTLPGNNGPYEYGAYGEWVREFTRGLLLLRTQQYKDAQRDLVRNLERAVLEVEERQIMRLAASLAFVASGEVSDARRLLNGMSARSAYLRHLAQVLEYHVSVLEQDDRRARHLYEALSRRRNDSALLWKAAEAVKRREFVAAVRFEVDAMLSLAA